MPETTPPEGHDPSSRPADSPDNVDEPIPAMQSLLDNPFLLLFIGVAVPTVLYTVWGVMEVAHIPIAN